MRRRRLVSIALAVASLTALAACGSDDPGDEPTGGSASTIPSGTASPGGGGTPSVEPSTEAPRVVAPTVIGEVATGLFTPWGLAFLPDGTALVSERNTGKIDRIGDDGTVTEVGRIDRVVHAEESGLLGLAVSPDYATDQLIYAFYTTATGNQIARMTYDGSALGDPQVIVDDLPKNTIHNGGRIHFGPDGMLYAGVGDAGDTEAAQDTSVLNGKILRIAPDGSVPADNPFGNLVWSYGHRNVQGFGWDDEGRMWASEFGQDTWDELNQIEPGNNYGWPVVEGQAGRDGMVDPVVQWTPDDASCSDIAVVGAQVYLACLKGQRMWQVPNPAVSGQTSLEPVAWFVQEYGRMREVTLAPDGTLWLVTSNTDGRGSPRDGDDRILQVQITLD